MPDCHAIANQIQSSSITSNGYSVEHSSDEWKLPLDLNRELPRKRLIAAPTRSTTPDTSEPRIAGKVSARTTFMNPARIL
jgi:hypothetical protein